jgi:serpin B
MSTDEFGRNGMPHPALDLVLRHLRRVRPPAAAGDPTDGQFLERFVAQRDEAAFEALLRRHGTMVWNVCQRVLANASDADDAFQATFLVLVRKAGFIAKRDSVGSWLHGVAHRVALDARAVAGRRRAHERQAAARLAGAPAGDGTWSEVRQVLDEELGRLPEKYRAPLVLCYLEGKTNDEAACLLGWTRGTIAGRLSRARDLLRDRLTRRGLAFSSGALTALLAADAVSAAAPGDLLTLTLGAALRPAEASVAALAEGVLRTMVVSRLKVFTVLVAVCILAGTGAGWWLHQALARPPVTDPEGPVVVKPLVLADDPVQALRDRPALVRGNNAFAWDLYARLRQEDGNIVSSPYSISTALAMTYAGARGETAEQMARVLHFTLPAERFHPATAALVRDLGGEEKGQKRCYQLSVANALWGQKDYGFRKDFLALTRTCYGAGLSEVDYRTEDSRDQARQTINAWVEKQTHDKIKDLVQKQHLTELTRLVLTNAVYFKADWQTKFKPDETKDDSFQVSKARTVKVPLMEQTTSLPYLDGGTFQMAELPYTGKELSMLVLLPKKADGLADLEKDLSADRVAGWHGKLHPTWLTLSLPKFKVAGTYDLKTILLGLGLDLAFDPDRADFSGMNSKKELSIQAALHKAYIEVNEEGTLAAGATAVSKPGNPDRPDSVRFRADHPFLFMIRDNQSGSVLFLGRVIDPTRE